MFFDIRKYNIPIIENSLFFIKAQLRAIFNMGKNHPKNGRIFRLFSLFFFVTRIKSSLIPC